VNSKTDLSKIIKAYDIRGLVGSEINPEFAFLVGASFAKFLEESKEPSTIVIGEDMRPSSPELANAFSKGAQSIGFDVIRIGLSSTDMLYFASGALKLPGAMFTASHNPASYNGIKLCLSEARPVGKDTGLARIQELIETGIPMRPLTPGVEKNKNLLDEYVNFLLSLIPEFSNQSAKNLKKLKIVIDAGNGMAGFTAPAIFAKLPFEIIPMYFELDGNFPNHEANPIEPENLKALQKKVKQVEADIGLAFDGDADRCFLIDNEGELVPPSAVTALIAQRELAKNPGATIIYNLISSQAVPELVEELGGVSLRSKVGHSYIKAEMGRTGAIFGGEHSGHFYFKDFWKADSGALAALHVVSALATSKKPLHELLAPYNKYFQSGELNLKLDPKAGAAPALAKVKAHFADQATFDELDGLTVSLAQGWFNLRPSNTEPLLRLNIEGFDEKALKMIKKEVLGLLE
jgi:phosphomannomutase